VTIVIIIARQSRKRSKLLSSSPFLRIAVFSLPLVGASPRRFRVALFSTALTMPKDQPQHPVAIHWYRNGLRFHDNPPLKDACDGSKHLIPLYIIDPESPFAQTPGRKAGCIRADFVLESIKEIDQELRKMNSQLIVIRGKPEVVLPEVVAATSADALFYEKEAASPIREADAIVLKAIAARQRRDKTSSICNIKGYETHNLHSMEHYLAKCKGGTAPSTYGGFSKIFQSMTVPKEVETVTSVPPLPAETYQTLESLFSDSIGIPTLEQIGYSNVKEQLKNRKNGGVDFDGGEKAALALLDVMKSRPQWVSTFEKPKTSPNALAVDTTGLSPYVKHGCLSPRTFFHELSKIYAKYNPKNCSKPPVSLHGQLMWREYNYLMAYSTPKIK
jgi:cryptochrome